MTKKKFDRIMEWHDITQVRVAYEDSTEDFFFVKYKEEDEGADASRNAYQKVYLSKPGNLYIVIDPDKDIDYLRGLGGDIDDEKVMESRKRMIRNV